MDVILGWMSHWQGALAVVLVLGALIFFHELGHFSAARLFGMGVRTFSLGFGPKLWRIRRGKTEYCLSLCPLGGYVALVGESGDGPEDEEVLRRDEENGVRFTEEESFHAHPAWQRLVVVLAGPAANFVLALAVCCGVCLLVGRTVMTTEIGQVVEGSPAAAAGVLPGDSVCSIDGREIAEWGDVGSTIDAGGGKEMTVVFSRDLGREVMLFTRIIKPEAKVRRTVFGEERTAWMIGVGAAGKHRQVELGPLDALGAGCRQTRDMVVLTWTGLEKLARRVVPMDQVGGPIMIAQVVGRQAEHGIVGVLLIGALISVNLGILNLLPIPVLDGGTAVFFLYEVVFRRPVPDVVRDWGGRIGLGLLVALMLLATWNDVWRLIPHD